MADSGPPALIGLGAVVGSVIGGYCIGTESAASAGFFYGAGIGATLWLLFGAMFSGSALGTAAVITVIGGAWAGGLIAGAGGILPGAFWGSALLLGWWLNPQTRRFGYWALTRWACRTAQPVQTSGIWNLTDEEIEDARYLYATDEEYAAEVDALAETDPAAAAELSGGLAGA